MNMNWTLEKFLERLLKRKTSLNLASVSNGSRRWWMLPSRDGKHFYTYHSFVNVDSASASGCILPYFIDSFKGEKCLRAER
ncbi:hypothetical protein CDAR_222001, partial [Caerostris darwini]